ncbi:MAG: alkaline phosphatase D family protein [Mycobacteriales bacterium]
MTRKSTTQVRSASSPPDRGANAARRRALTRRTFIGVTLGGAAAAISATAAAAAPARGVPDPFRLGVASGDPTASGVVLWTRLAVDPLAEDGAGGMPNRRILVEWQIAADAAMTRDLRRGVALADPAWGHSVHVEVGGLAPYREYFYRFRTGPHLSETGRTVTLPAAGTAPELRAISLSCSHYEGGYFTAYHHAAVERPDVVFELGDYIYEGAGVPGRVRVHPGGTCLTLADYRRRYALYRNEPETRELHAVAPWIVTWDDHEVQDNWAGIYDRTGVTSDAFLARRAAAAQAYYEFMPLRASSIPNGPDIQLYRRFQWGDLATFHVMDTRQYRDSQACNDGGRTWWYATTACSERYDAGRTMAGMAQDAWLLDGFQSSSATWQLIPQGDFFSQRDISAGSVTTLATDGWDGYVADRNRIRDGWVSAGQRNAVVLTGDVHAHFANDIKADFDDPDSATVGVELVATSITSGGDGSTVPSGGATVLAENPWIHYIEDRRGYVLITAAADRLRADFRTVPYVTKRGADIAASRSYVVEVGSPGLQPG